MAIDAWVEKVQPSNIITIAILLVGGVFGYAKLESRVVSAEIGLQEVKLNYARQDVAMQREQNLINKLDDLRFRLERMEKKLDLYK